MAVARRAPLLLLLLAGLLLAAVAAAGAGDDAGGMRRWLDDDLNATAPAPAPAAAGGPPKSSISYGALTADVVPCSVIGASYYNCRAGAEANPYERGCSAITQCRD